VGQPTGFLTALTLKAAVGDFEGATHS